MGNEQASRIVQAPGIETNQDELARPPIVRYSIGNEDTGYFSENRKHDNAVLNATTKRSGAASFQILPPKQAEVFRTPEECHRGGIFIFLSYFFVPRRPNFEFGTK